MLRYSTQLNNSEREYVWTPHANCGTFLIELSCPRFSVVDALNRSYFPSPFSKGHDPNLTAQRDLISDLKVRTDLATFDTASAFRGIHMADDNSGTIHDSSDGGVAGKHDHVDSPRLLLGPATSGEFNSATLRLIPIACFRVDDIRFAFDSSFVGFDPADEKNDIRAELKLLVNLRKDNPESPLSVFGHADPVGSDDFNKQLSGRRATVIYALLISTTDPDTATKLWQRVAREENWGPDQRQQMQALTGLPAGTADATLFKTYMQKLAPADLKVSKKDFLAQGADAGGKGDYQGCSEFNPKLIFSTQRNSEFEKDSDKTVRNDANGLNRRVIVLLFQKGSKITPASWPCPRATEGVAGCRKRFWSDGEKRRSTRLPDKDRKFDDTKDTFACRFYHRLLTNSPCESELTIVKIRLFDAQARPLPFAPCLTTESGQTKAARATGAPPSPLGTTSGSAPGNFAGGNIEEGIVTVRVKKLPTTVKVRWSRPKATETSPAPLPDPADLDDFEFQMDVAVDIPDADPQAATTSRLKNLGYDTDPKRKEVPGMGDPVQAFQRDYKPQFADIIVDGTLNQPTINDSKSSHDGTKPVLRAGSDIDLKR